jgi:general secretion pathway protein D
MAALNLAACGGLPKSPPATGHLDSETGKTAVRAPVAAAPVPAATAAPAAPVRPETYGVVVNNIAVQDLLFALARDARINIDIYPGIGGTVTLNAVDQTLEQLLTRIARQVDVRWEMAGTTLAIMPDSPFLRLYRVDYVNVARDTAGTVTVTTQIASTGAPAGAPGTTVINTGNNSQTRIENKSQHRFWETLERNIKEILRETDKVLPEGTSETVIEHADQQETSGTGQAARPQLPAMPQASPASPVRRTAPQPQAGIAASQNPAVFQQSGTTVVRRTTFREAASVIVNPETGIVSVRATSRQHDKVREFLDEVTAAARRQVLIEATVVEVSLSDNYQQGIDWQALPLGRAGFRLIQQAAGSISAPAASLLQLSYVNRASRAGDLSATVKLLDAFGGVKVLSSPKLSVINNQTAVLKVVDNLVYFTIRADTTSNQTTTTTTYTTNLNSVPVGLVMNVTPQISGDGTVLLAIRPSISRKFGEVVDPNPDLQRLGIKNSIPVIRTREMESMIRVADGNIAVMGGLMEDMLESADQSVPAVSRLPLIGRLFENRDDSRRKTELVVFLRPTVIKEASLAAGYAAFRDRLPDSGFFADEAGPAETAP